MAGNLGWYEWITTAAKQVGGADKLLQNVAQQGYDKGVKQNAVGQVAVVIFSAVVFSVFTAVANSKKQAAAEQKITKAEQKAAAAERRAAEAEAKLNATEKDDEK